jgi:hypothetical protein
LKGKDEMKTNLHALNAKIWVAIAIGFALMLLVSYPQSATAQTNTFPSTGNTGVGTTTPDQKLVVSVNSATTLPASAGIIQLFGANGVQPIIAIDGFATAPVYLLRRANTSAASPSALQANDLMGVFGVAGYGSTAYQGTRARVGFFASENWTNSANGTYMVFNTTANGAATAGGTERMRIDNAGNVGIGTTSPGAKLVLSTNIATLPTPPPNTIVQVGSVEGLATRFTVDGFAAPAQLIFRRADTTAASPSAIQSGDLIGRFGAWGYGSTGYSTYTTANIDFGADQTWTDSAQGSRITFSTSVNGSAAFPVERMRIDNAGNVGIGTSPASGNKLDVYGNTNVTGNLTASGIINAVGGVNLNGTPITSSQWTTSGSTINYTGGNIGIGATSPQSKLSVNTSTQSPGSMLEINNRGDLTAGSWSAIRFGLDSNSYPNQYAKGGIIYESRDGYNRGKLHLVVNTAANTANMSLSDARLTVDGTTGNVGIGKPDPTFKLDVAGNINATGLNINGSPVTGSQWTTSGSNINYGTAGNVGIGIATPTSKLDVAGNINATGTINAMSGLNINGSPVTSSQWTTSGSNISYTVANGNVGIGTAPASGNKLDILGKTNVTGDLNATGTITGGNIVAKYQDMAEWVPSSEQLSTGTVVVLDSTKSNQVIACTHAYDTRVAGVISEQPGIALGEGGAGKVLVATTGRVFVNVDATKSPIHIGDLLVTSDRPGVAMKSEPVNVGGVQLHRPGTLIGKALEPLEKGSGKILVLLSLQ